MDLYEVANAAGMALRLTNYGGIITSLRVPDARGKIDDVVLGFDRPEDYLGAHPYFGAIIGRYGNRIARARFTLDGKTYQLAANDGVNHLHGGEKGFDKVIWETEPFRNRDRSGIILTYTSPDGEEGYPGTLAIRVMYTLTDDNELMFDYEAICDQATPVNLTQHSYFNLAGHGHGSILDHALSINAEKFTPVDATLIPTGELRDVSGTPFDFRKPKRIGDMIDADDRQLCYGHGFDHNFVLVRPHPDSGALVLAARVAEPVSGRQMEVYTTEPGMQFYSGNLLDGTITGKSGAVYHQHAGFCLETQHFPDSPNQSQFPSTILRPGQTYRSRTVYAFGTV